MNQAKITIGKRSSQVGTGTVSIEITDRTSGLRVVEVEMEYKDFTECLMGLAYCEGLFTTMPTEYSVQRYGKNKTTEKWSCDKSEVFGKDPQRNLVLYDFKKRNDGNWELWDDGTSSQQNLEKHKYTVCKYINSGDDNETTSDI